MALAALLSRAAIIGLPLLEDYFRLFLPAMRIKAPAEPPKRGKLLFKQNTRDQQRDRAENG
jgi:hypothetical protein